MGRQPFNNGIFNIRLYVCNVIVTREYFAMSMIQIQFQYNESKKTHLTIECVQWYSIYGLMVAETYIVQDISARYESFKQLSLIVPYYDVKQLVEAGFSCTNQGRRTMECKACGLKFHLNRGKLEGFNPYKLHQRRSPDCEFFKETELQNNITHGATGFARGESRVLQPSPRTSDQTDYAQRNEGRIENEDNKIQHSHHSLIQPKSSLHLVKQARIKSFQDPNWPRDTVHQQPCELADAGFFYTGDKDIVRCFRCGIELAVWNPDDDPWVEHARHSPECPYLRDKKDPDYINDIQKKWNHTPKHPQFTQTDERRRSYENTGWPRDNVLQAPKLLAAAGFFYTGIGDTVCCYYCGGGLREWEPEDDPWVEHARWFPFCKFLLKIKGIDFIQASATGNPDNGIQEPVASPAVPQNNAHYTPKIRNEKMSRISSYSIWPHRNIRTGPLVEAGFSCKDPNTSTVECKSCGLEINASNLNGMNPMQYHRENSSDCELFHQTNSGRPRGQQNRPLTDSSPNPVVPPVGVNQEAAARSLVQQPPGNNQKKQSTQANVSYAQTHSENSNGNICIDEATSPNSHRQAANASPLFSNSRGASLDLLTADERPRTGEASDRTVSTVQNNNNLSSSGEEVRENENMIGALGGENPHQIRNPRYTEQKTRRESFAHWPHRARHDIEGLVNAGFFYTGAEDIVRCFFCDIGLAEWNPDDDPWMEHARHSPECPYLRDQKGQDYINNFQTQWARIYTPKHPQYTQMDARRRSYVNTSWPRDNVLQTPELLAAAGFFYMGDGDTVRCHYCDGGLREWEPEDDPWVEHARWFPFCKFLLKIKGIDFIQSTAIKNKTVAPPAAQRYNADPLVERRRTDTISPLTVPNNERTTGREVVRQNNNATVGAHGGDIPYLIRNPRYTEQNARCQTYLYWTHQAKPDINCLVNAGFFYTGDRDIVRCFSCDIERAEWNPDDDPWVEHARHSPECPYLRDQRGQDYINNIQEQCARPDNGFQEPVASLAVPQNNAHDIHRTGSTLPWDEDEDEMDLGDGL